MNAQHTPEPWSVSNEVEDGWRMVMANGKIVANVNPESFSVGVADFLEMPAEANAILIAAAPELLEALQAARLNYIDTHAIAIPEEQTAHPLLVQMDAAIAKATNGGQP